MAARLLGGRCDYRGSGLTEPELTGTAEEQSEGRVFISIDKGSGTATYYLSPEFKGVKAFASGTVETLDPGYDWVRVTVDGEQILYLQSTQNKDECGYEGKSGSGAYNRDEGCQACPIKIFIEAGPNDNICNDGVQWTVTISPVR